MNRPRLIIPMRADQPVHSYAGMVRDLPSVQRWPDHCEVTEWLGGEPVTVVRMRTQERLPVPLGASDWARFEALLGGGSR